MWYLELPYNEDRMEVLENLLPMWLQQRRFDEARCLQAKHLEMIADDEKRLATVLGLADKWRETGHMAEPGSLQAYHHSLIKSLQKRFTTITLFAIAWLELKEYKEVGRPQVAYLKSLDDMKNSYLGPKISCRAKFRWIARKGHRSCKQIFYGYFKRTMIALEQQKLWLIFDAS